MSQGKIKEIYNIAVKVKECWCNQLLKDWNSHIVSISPQVDKINDEYIPVVVIGLTDNSIQSKIPNALPLLDINGEIIEYVSVRIEISDAIISAC